MFEQFKENIRLTGETYVAAKKQFRGAREAFKTAPRFKKLGWEIALGAILITAVTSRFAIPWYYQVASVVFIAAIALMVGYRSAHRTDS
jgi:hypothetical protein